MKRKTRFNDGGMNRNPFQGDDVDPFSAVRDAAGSTDPRQEGPSSEAFYDETTGKMLGTRRNLETGEYYSTEPVAPKEKPAARPAPKAPEIKDVPGSGRGTMAGRRAIDDIMRDAGGGGRGRSMGRSAEDKDTFTPGKGKGRAEIPVDSSMSGPEKRSSSAMNMSDTERNLMNLLMASTRGMSRVGGKAIQNNRALGSAEQMAKPMLSSAKEAVKGAASRAGESLKEAGRTVSKTFNPPPKASASAGQASKERAAALKEAEPILQRRPDTKSDRLKRTKKFDEDMRDSEFSKGGMASRRADGCAMRGKTRGKIY